MLGASTAYMEPGLASNDDVIKIIFTFIMASF